MYPNVRLRDRNGADGGRWFVAVDDTRQIAFINAELEVFQREEPASGWRLETRGETADWHPVLGGRL